MWSLSDSNWIRTDNHLVRKQTLNNLALRQEQLLPDAYLESYQTSWVNSFKEIINDWNDISGYLESKVVDTPHKP